MSDELSAFLAACPRAVHWQSVVDFDRVPERVAAIGTVLADTVGIDREDVCWSPIDIPPSAAETLAWVWVVRPDLSAAIAERADSMLRDAMDRYSQAQP